MANREKYDDAKVRLDRYHKAWNLVQIQAQMDFWLSLTDNIEIALLQRELRRLHAVIEGDDETLYSKDDLT